jgi:hypothetical protein
LEEKVTTLGKEIEDCSVMAAVVKVENEKIERHIVLSVAVNTGDCTPTQVNGGVAKGFIFLVCHSLLLRLNKYAISLLSLCLTKINHATI